MTTIADTLTRYIAHQLAAQRPPVRLDNKKIDPKLAAYEDELDELLEDALAGSMGKDEFRRKWEAAALAILLLSFTAGSGGTMTAAGKERLAALEKIAKDSTAGLADDIYSGKYEDNPEGLEARKGLWVHSAEGAYEEGLVHDPDDPFYEWVYGDTQHCGDCSRLNGQVHRASAWREAGWQPQSDRLECHGFYCQCELVPSDGPESGDF